jgi:hypothetical protein
MKKLINFMIANGFLVEVSNETTILCEGQGIQLVIEREGWDNFFVSEYDGTFSQQLPGQTLEDIQDAYEK